MGGSRLINQQNITVATLVKRPNRFLGLIRLGSDVVEAFIPNPGRMHELLYPGKKVFVRKADHSHRRTSYDVIGVEHDGVRVSIDSNLPNRFMKQLLVAKRFAPFAEYDTIVSEPRVYEGRFDFRLEGESGVAFIEVKSCTLVEDGHAIFPDAPTVRGARHMHSLSRTLSENLASRAAVVFIIQRPDARLFSPNDPMDPKFGDALRDAHSVGVEVYALSCRVVNWNLETERLVPVDLEFFIG